jgi:CPA1 family monovalent cation:H+ antiporter
VSAFEILGALLAVAAAFAYVNHRWIRLPPAIGLMALGLVASLVLILIDRLGILPLQASVERLLDRVAFSDTLLHGMLGVLLFAGALHINLNDLREERAAIAVLAVGSTIVSTAVIGTLSFLLLRAVGLHLPFGYCLLFGAVIAPTDPIGVLGILKQARIPKRLETQIAGESLFNDGVGVVLFLAVLGVVTRGGGVTFGEVATIFAREALGGAAFGFASGYVAYRLVKSIDHYQTELLVTLALVLGGYAVAERLHISAPIAAVVSGLLIGNQGRALAMSDVTRDHLDKFWSLIDEIMNTVLFVLVGFEVIRLRLTREAVVAGVLMIPIVLAARLVSVALPALGLRRWIQFARGTVAILTWGGLRGGISVALALSLPSGRERDVVVVMTYFVVVFSVLAQGLTLKRVARRFA